MTNIKDAPLKPCPFCGGGAVLVKSLPGCDYVKCSVCGADSDDTRGVEKWNTRASTASPDREKVALQARLKNVLGVMKGARLRCEPMAIWADDVKAIEDAIDTITPDEAAIRAAAFEEAAKIADAAMLQFADLLEHHKVKDAPQAKECATICAKAAREIADAIRAQEAGR